MIVKKSHMAAYGKFGSGDLSHAEARRRGEGWRTSSRAVTGGPTSVSAVNVPFEIPKGWAWCRISDVAKIITGATPRTSRRDFFDGDIPFIKPADIGINKNIGVTAETLTELGANQVRPIPANAVCVCCIGSLGKVGVASSRSCTNQQINSIVSSYLLSDFMYYIASSGYFTDTLKSLASAITIALVNKSRMATIPIPLPPLAEQKRIVARIEELFMVADLLGEAANKLEVTAKRLDKKILDLAIRGKLVQQDPNDEPASELVKRIAASHKSPSKNQSEPIDPPFEIPDSWEWVRLGKILQPLQSKLPQGEFFRYIDIDAIDNKNNVVKKPKCIAVAEAPSRATRGLKSGDTLFSVVRPYLRNIAYIDDSLEDCIASTGFYVCRPYEIDSRFLFKLLLSDYVVTGLNAFMKGDNSPSIRVDHIQSFLIPLPPLAEQKRIVAKIEELRTVIKSLTT